MRLPVVLQCQEFCSHVNQACRQYLLYLALFYSGAVDTVEMVSRTVMRVNDTRSEIVIRILFQVFVRSSFVSVSQNSMSDCVDIAD